MDTLGFTDSFSDTFRHEGIQYHLQKIKTRKSFIKKCKQFGWLPTLIIPEIGGLVPGEPGPQGESKSSVKA